MKKTLIILLVLISVLARSEETVRFKYTVAPTEEFIRVDDSFMSKVFGDVPFGSNKHLSVSGNSVPSNVILKFDITGYIPMSAIVSKAIIVLRPKVQTSIESGMKWIMIATGWKENEVTWNVASGGEKWDSSGGDTFVKQQSEIMIESDGYHTWNVTDIAQRWVKFPARNYGAILKMNNSDSQFECWYYSSETDISEYRPELVISYLTVEEVKRKEEEAKKKKEDATKKELAKRLEKGRKNEEDIAEQTPRPSAPWIVCELKNKEIKKWSEIAEITPNVIKGHEAFRPTAVLSTNNARKDAALQKYGTGYIISYVKRSGGKYPQLEVRNKSNAYMNIDVDNDGDFEKKESFKVVKGIAGPVTLSNIYHENNKPKVLYDYSFYIYKESGKWCVRHGGYRLGTFNGKEVRVFDSNDNFKFNDFGFDEISIGGKRQYLNKGLKIDGQWYELSIPPTGEFIAFQSFKDLGKADPVLAAVNLYNFNPGKKGFLPEYVMFQRIDSPEMYRADRKNRIIRIPRGKYKVAYGMLSSRKVKVKIIVDGAGMAEIDLTSKQEYKLKWGFPLSLKFKVKKKKNTYSVDCNSATMVGSAGAEYSVIGKKNIYLMPPRVEVYLNRRLEGKKSSQKSEAWNKEFTDVSITVKKDGKYQVKMIVKTILFGELEGEVIE